MIYEINLNAVTDELVETYNRLLHNDVCIADTYRDRAIKDFKGTINLFVLTGRLEDDEKALRYIDIIYLWEYSQDAPREQGTHIRFSRLGQKRGYLCLQ